LLKQQLSISNYRLPPKENKLPFSISIIVSVFHLQKTSKVAIFRYFRFPFAEFRERGDMDLEKWEQEDMETLRHGDGDMETWNYGDWTCFFSHSGFLQLTPLHNTPDLPYAPGRRGKCCLR
jgi:hypothetical protein